MKKYYVNKCWRAVGAPDYDIFHRDTKREILAEEILGEPEEVYSVLIHSGRDATEDDPHVVVADCYCRADANKVRDALNLQQMMAGVSAHGPRGFHARRAVLS